MQTSKLEALATAALFLAPAAAVLERCTADGSLFALHPAANALAFLVLMPAALFAMLERKQVKDHATRVFLTKLHLYLNLAACALIGVAGFVVYSTKKEAGEKHMRTPHAWAALVTSVFFLLNIFQGLLLTLEGGKANWQWKDETHIMTGILVYIGGVGTLIYGLSTESWGAVMFSVDRQFQLTVLIVAANVALVGKSIFLQRSPPTLSKTE